MDKTMTLEEFYNQKLDWMPEGLQKELGHFNVFRMENLDQQPARPTTYSRKDFFKMSIFNGKGILQYADKEIEVDGQAMFFSNPQVPYNWESFETHPCGYFCIFTEAFFANFGNIKDYPVFRPGGHPIYYVNDEQAGVVNAIYQRMLAEIGSDYVYKYDVLRNLVFELVHIAMKLQPASGTIYHGSNGNTRVSSLFTELLERQFPIETPRQQIKFRSPAEFALQLSLHVNHLNRALKEVTGKTTSQLIGERVCQEARTLLRHTDWNVSEIAWCLGFEELPHFIHFFKKGTTMTPRNFRMSVV
jgi:AraC-like DNA-binding protein